MPAPERGVQRAPALELRWNGTRKPRRKDRRRVLRGRLDQLVEETSEVVCPWAELVGKEGERTLRESDVLGRSPPPGRTLSPSSRRQSCVEIRHFRGEPFAESISKSAVECFR